MLQLLPHRGGAETWREAAMPDGIAITVMRAQAKGKRPGRMGHSK
jgi:hypothetical protein